MSKQTDTYMQRRREILEAAERCVLRDGLDGVKTMMSIASEALVDPKVRAILTAANKRVCERVIANISDEDRELIERLPPGVLEVRMQLTRSMLESVRVLLVFDDDLDPVLIRNTLVDRLTDMFIDEIARDYGVPPEVIARRV